MFEWRLLIVGLGVEEILVNTFICSWIKEKYLDYLIGIHIINRMFNTSGREDRNFSIDMFLKVLRCGRSRVSRCRGAM